MRDKELANSGTMAGRNHEKKKRSRIEVRSSSSSSSSEVWDFSRYGVQDLLIEVIDRLPTTESAFQCKCVCKTWYSFISNPDFVRRFITHKFNHQYKQKPSTVMIGYHGSDGYRLFTVSDEPMFKSSRFDLKYLVNDHEKGRLFKVLAIYKDLMLCSVDGTVGSGRLRCFICNPFMMHWAILPLLECDQSRTRIQIGFVCEPYYFKDSKGECTLNSKFRFRVVHINEAVTNDNENKRFILWTYCSETQEWCKSVLQGSEYRSVTDVVACNGKLLWYNGSHIFAYDPFNPDLSTFIDCSDIRSMRFPWIAGEFCIGLCQGSLRMMNLQGWRTPKSLAIWELKDYAKKEWRLEDKFYLDTMLAESQILDASNQTSLDQEFVGGRKYLSPLVFHPNDRDIVYLYFGGLIISCNTRKRELKVVVKIPCEYMFYRRGNVFHIELPLWPTPIPELSEMLP